ncbi:hypothetical protein EPA93_20815 [Ktedonosporobacter rubrisoli]|uniref:Anaphase-promoting complex subunit 4-like WD40 domain-containing protein n=1 Tax=Ktedonosporobacter rubrisoli TaxID=2509675 RepID=A0A4P6JS19_KTERU|nr:EsaB/YukD family protein [Ktedonosporobacter rubrisoli]QBD78308.1 hypothetical protein EPA93_20815 [Ktedonosporobacter rubrisoli]
MRKVKVLIEENAFGAVRPAELAVDIPVSALVPILVKELGLPQTDLFGNRLVYILRHTANGAMLPESATLEDAGVTPGARLALASFVANEAFDPSLLDSSALRLPDPTFYSSATLADAEYFTALPQRKNTSGLLPAVKRPPNATRRAFLVLSGAILGIGSVGIGYAAFRAWEPDVLKKILSNSGSSIVQQSSPPASSANRQSTQAIQAKPTITFTRHRQQVRTIAWSHDGMLASGGDDARVFIWGVDGTVRQILPQQDAVRALAWSGDGQRLVTGANNRITFFNVVSGEMLAHNHRHMGTVTSLAWATQGQQLAVSGSIDRRVIVWNTFDYHEQEIFSRHTAPIEVVSWSADGQTVASASQGGVIRVWSAASAREIHGLYLLDGQVSVHALAFAPTGSQLVAGGDDGIVRLWDGLSCKIQANGEFGPQCMDGPRRIQVSNTAIRSLAWSPDSRLLAVGTDDGTLSIWAPGQGQKPLLRLQQNAPVSALTWSARADQLASASGNTVTVWQLS